MGFGTTTVEFCPPCCNQVCDFDEVTMAISGTTVPCEGECGTGFLGGFDYEVVSGSMDGGYVLMGSGGSVSYYQADVFVIRLYAPGQGCTGDFQEISGGLQLSISCDEFTDPPLSATAYITINDPPELAALIFSVGGPFDLGNNFNFGDVVPVCGGSFTVSL